MYKKQLIMNTSVVQRRQTIFRFEEDFLSKLKYYAEREDKSLNAYVESVLKSEIGRRESLPKLVISKNISRNVSKISGVLSGRISAKDLENDDRLAYLLRK